MKLNQKERIDDLENGYKIIQNEEGFKFGIDSVLLADFAKNIKRGSKVIDLGTGTGIVSTLLCAKTQLRKIVGVEIQREMAEMAERSVKLNKLTDRMEIINCNIKELNKLYKHKEFDIIVTNPPYQKIGTGVESKNEKELIARHEIKATFEDFAKISAYLLNDYGTMYIVHRPERMTQIILDLKKYKLEPKEIRFVYPKKGKNSNIVLIKAVKNAKESLKILEPLYVYNEENYTEEILKIYGKK